MKHKVNDWYLMIELPPNDLPPADLAELTQKDWDYLKERLRINNDIRKNTIRFFRNSALPTPKESPDAD